MIEALQHIIFALIILLVFIFIGFSTALLRFRLSDADSEQIAENNNRDKPGPP